MNMQALEELAQWLEAGAPHVKFNMDMGRVNEMDLDESGWEDYTNKATYQFTSGMGDCGTACCIAGYAAHIVNNFMTPKEGEWENWGNTRDTALKALGLSPEDCDMYEGGEASVWYGHILFDNGACPADTTPQEAAIAVREVMKGNHLECWKPVFEARKAEEMAE